MKNRMARWIRDPELIALQQPCLVRRLHVLFNREPVPNEEKYRQAQSSRRFEPPGAGVHKGK